MLATNRSKEVRSALVAKQDAEARKTAEEAHDRRMKTDPEYARVHRNRERAAATHEVARIENRLSARKTNLGTLSAEIDRLSRLLFSVGEREPARALNLGTKRDELNLERRELLRVMEVDEALLLKAKAVLAALKS